MTNKNIKYPILEGIKKCGIYFIPKGSELIDITGSVHSTSFDQALTKKNFGVKTNEGEFIPKFFSYVNLNSQI